jgi:hypothetical protein
MSMTLLLAAVQDTIQPTDGAQAEIAQVLGVSEPFVSKCVKRGWFPPGRARTLADKYDVPFIDLVAPRLRPFVNQ